jgi:hypothetical protein
MLPRPESYGHGPAAVGDVPTNGRRAGPVSLTLCLLALWSPALTWGAYVTDQVVAGVYAQASQQQAAIRALTSGTPLFVLERQQDWVKVRLPDNSSGWIRKQFVTDEKPARLLLVEAQARTGELQRELRQLRERAADCAPSDAAGGIDGLPLTGAMPACWDQQARDQLQRTYRAVRQVRDRLGELLPQEVPSEEAGAGWLRDMLVAALAGLLGFALGFALVAWRVLRRYGRWRW